MKPKLAQENWYRVAICLHEFGQRLVAPRLQILEILWVIGAEPHHHGKVADLGGAELNHVFGFSVLICKKKLSASLAIALFNMSRHQKRFTISEMTNN